MTETNESETTFDGGPSEPRHPDHNPDREHIMQFFAYTHLPPHLREVSERFAELAEHLVEVIPSNPERTAALRKMLEAKDAAVRARLARENG